MTILPQLLGTKVSRRTVPMVTYRQRFDVHLYHYCLLDNHFHLLLQLAQPRQLSRLMASMLVAYVRYFQRRYRFVGHVFQGRFKSPAIEAESYLLSCGRYLERNPVAANLVQDAWQYRWSSCRAYALGVNDSLLASNPWYEQWSPEPTRRQVVNLRHRGSHESGEMGQRWWPHSR